ncbi:MAG: CapA family protein [Firmicutes bacterium]|nr:CapA family protein [Bacillota bacterium]
MLKKTLYLAVLACLFLTGCFLGADGGSMDSRDAGGIEFGDEPVQESPVLPPEDVYRQATVAAVGDIMVHRTQYVRAYNPQTGHYDFRPSFEAIASYLQEADLVVGNLETTFGGEMRGFSAYPRFNSPDGIALALQEAGFDLLCTANNHCLDTGEKGLYRTIEVIEETGMKHFGTARNREERDSPLIVEVNGIKLFFLAYTYGTNGLPIPKGKEYIVNLLVEEQMIADLAGARRQGADLVILYLHWGEEYCSEPSEGQKRLARVAAQAGADIILGSHPHIIQPMEYITVPGEQGVEKRVFVAYSMGNFLSNQHRVEGSISTDEVEFGKILYLHLEKNVNTGEAYLRDVNYELTWVNRDDKHRILPLNSVFDEGSKGHVALSAALVGRLKRDGERLQERLKGFEQAAPRMTVPVGAAK